MYINFWQSLTVEISGASADPFSGHSASKSKAMNPYSECRFSLKPLS